MYTPCIRDPSGSKFHINTNEKHSLILILQKLKILCGLERVSDLTWPATCYYYTECSKRVATPETVLPVKATFTLMAV